MCHPAWARARAEAKRLEDLARLRRVRDRIDREHARPLDVLALARAVDLPAGLLSREFRDAYGMSPYSYLVARRAERARTAPRQPPIAVRTVTRSATKASSDGATRSRPFLTLPASLTRTCVVPSTA